MRLHPRAKRRIHMLDFALSAFITLLLVIDPVGLAPALLAATAGMPDTIKRTIALSAPLIAASTLVVIARVCHRAGAIC
nr:hypothetical protein [Bradyrhizobium hipponense]